MLRIYKDNPNFCIFYFDNSKENFNFAPMKKLFFTHLFALVAVFAMAVPVQRGQWRTITLADGSKVRVETVGDEYFHYFRSAAGDAYVKINDAYVKTDVSKYAEEAEMQRAEANALRAERFEKYFGNKFGAVSNGKKKLPGFKQLEGVKKGLVILVQFPDLAFRPEHTPDFYKKVLNQGGENYPEIAAKGYGKSVKQYFLDQSNDKFTVDFDVSRVVTMPQNHDYYYKTDDKGRTERNRVPELIRTAVNELKAEATLNWFQYDWDNDNEIDMVFILYAGYGQATKTDDHTLIWPHESSLGYYSSLTAGGKKFNTYACANEINWNFGEGDLDSGIGTFCHEFAHCLGYPDLYDVCSNHSDGCGLTAMDWWDLLDSGSYNGDSFLPAPFSIFEKMTAGWITPKELEAGMEYNNLRPITDKDGGDVYIMTNPYNKDEFYAFEPIQNKSWGAGFYKAQGLRVLHIDYDANVWANNSVNCKEYPGINKRSRYTYIPADGSYVCATTSQIRGDLFPYKTTNYVELEWYTGDDAGYKICPMRICDIKLNADGSVSYRTEAVGPHEIPEGVFYYESFNKCGGTGGNDGYWSNITLADLNPDNEWIAPLGKGARNCMIVGSNTQAGIATTSAITLEPGDYKLTFKAGRYGTEVPKISLSDPNNTSTVFAQSSFDLTAGIWNDCETKMTVGNTTSIRFRSPSKGRFFLDEVTITKYEDGPDAISAVSAENPFLNASGMYNLNGQKVGGDYRGIVIKNGKKYFTK